MTTIESMLKKLKTNLATLQDTSQNKSKVIRDFFTNAKQSDIDLSGTLFDDMDFSSINLSGLDLSNLIFKNCNFNDCNLQRAKLKNCQIIDSTLTNCDFTGANLTDAIIYKTTISRWNLTEAKLEGAYLCDVTKDRVFIDQYTFDTNRKPGENSAQQYNGGTWAELFSRNINMPLEKRFPNHASDNLISRCVEQAPDNSDLSEEQHNDLEAKFNRHQSSRGSSK